MRCSSVNSSRPGQFGELRPDFAGTKGQLLRFQHPISSYKLEIMFSLHRTHIVTALVKIMHIGGNARIFREEGFPFVMFWRWVGFR